MPGLSWAVTPSGDVIAGRGGHTGRRPPARERSRRMPLAACPSVPQVPDVDRFWSDADVLVEPDDPRPGAWAGGPSALLVDGTWWLAYRLRRPVGEGRGFANVVARSADGVRFSPVVEIGKDAFGAESLE